MRHGSAKYFPDHVRGVYPILLGVPVMLQIYAAHDIGWEAGARPLLAAVVIGVLISAVARRVMGQDIGAAVAAITMMGLLSATSPLKVAVFLLAVILVAIERWNASRASARLRVPWSKVTGTLDAFVITLVVVQVAWVSALEVARPKFLPPPSWTAQASDHYPDIYLLLADGHGRRDVLTDGYGYDMAEFAAAMEANGFRESGRSITNQSNTRLALPVLFNGRHLSSLNPVADLTDHGEIFLGPVAAAR